MTDCLKCHLPLDDRDDERGAVAHVWCPEDEPDLRAAIEGEGMRWFGVWLTTQRESGEHQIYLEPSMLDTLRSWLDGLSS